MEMALLEPISTNEVRAEASTHAIQEISLVSAEW